MRFSILFLFPSLMGFTLTPDQAKDIGNKIWRNECAGTINGLTHWKEGEEFPSLGIGHFIWKPKNCKAPFQETFPSLRWFMLRHGKRPPEVFRKECPWNSREEFLKDFNSKDTKAFRKFLHSTIDLQAAYIVKRFKLVLPKLVKHAPESIKNNVIRQFNRVAKSPNGLYALIDYVNFKGEGLSTSENYCNEGWGLLHVLSHMKGMSVGKDAIKEFIRSAKMVLEKRVFNAPRDKKAMEASWLKGWNNRLDTYL